GPEEIDFTDVTSRFETRSHFLQAIYGGDALEEVLRTMALRLPRTPVVIIDQAEECLTSAPLHLEQGGTAQECFLSFLARVADTSADLRILVSLRTEFYGRFRNELQLRGADMSGLRDYYLRVPDENDLAEAIARPTS